MSLPKQSGVAKLDTNLKRRRTTAGAILLLRVARHDDGVANLEQENMAYTVPDCVLCLVQYFLTKVN